MKELKDSDMSQSDFFVKHVESGEGIESLSVKNVVVDRILWNPVKELKGM